MTVIYWNMMSWSLSTSISDEPAASIFRAEETAACNEVIPGRWLPCLTSLTSLLGACYDSCDLARMMVSLGIAWFMLQPDKFLIHSSCQTVHITFQVQQIPKLIDCSQRNVQVTSLAEMLSIQRRRYVTSYENTWPPTYALSVTQPVSAYSLVYYLSSL